MWLLKVRSHSHDKEAADFLDRHFTKGEVVNEIAMGSLVLAEEKARCAFDKPFLNAAAGSKLNPCENRRVSLLDKANMVQRGGSSNPSIKSQISWMDLWFESVTSR